MYTVEKKDLVSAGLVLADAFREDPVWVRFFEDEQNQDQKMAAFFEMPVRHCFRFGRVVATSEQLEGIAAWSDSDKAEITFLRILASGSLGPGLKVGSALSKKGQPLFTLLKNDRLEHMAGRDHIYLEVIGVQPQHQGKGWGRILLETLFTESKERMLPVYLETETEKNRDMYVKCGFTVLKEIQVPEFNIPMWELLRNP